MTGITFQFLKFVWGSYRVTYALKLDYTDVLQHTHQAPDADDMVQVQLQHPDFKSNGRGVYSKNLGFLRQVSEYPKVSLKDILHSLLVILIRR